MSLLLLLLLSIPMPHTHAHAHTQVDARARPAESWKMEVDSAHAQKTCRNAKSDKFPPKKWNCPPFPCPRFGAERQSSGGKIIRC